MALDHMGNFVRHHARQFGLVIRRLDGSQIHKHGSTGKSKSIDFFLIHDVETIWPLLARIMRSQLTSQALHVNRDRIRIRKDRQLFADLGGRLLSRLNFLLGGEHVKAVRGLDSCCEQRRAHKKSEEHCQVACSDKLTPHSFSLRFLRLPCWGRESDTPFYMLKPPRSLPE